MSLTPNTKPVKAKNNSVMSKLYEKIKSVEEFHDIFKIGNSSEMKLIDERDYTLRYNLIKEENEEYLDACKNGDLVEIADALGDQLYILFGTILKHGLQHKIEEVYDEIHRSNMSKLDEKGEPIFREDGKILKSNLYFRPEIKKILDK
jgi:predicted HAD superfamily Cof-like phosphohydrolase